MLGPRPAPSSSRLCCRKEEGGGGAPNVRIGERSLASLGQNSREKVLKILEVGKGGVRSGLVGLSHENFLADDVLRHV